ncbi:hypothetical protein F443_19777 [Plasmopara halstedii]|uniref:FYVE-type domain-containing protein n=1 Tax=Plasmopara halstedii TaxID=4781 RepID=A0A0P1AEA8_PLAHL|nr:hypothetical protein F443_19777 [Plasmopara halstedii]CEG39164.1 hypothetical protein F443_19777 [Plasmopara halstedii]|eukprot:XP_024575533.1 hypothetical protein F443_19777 [Plasmopara halstedii]
MQQRLTFRRTGHEAMSSDIHRLVDIRQDLWSGFNTRLASTLSTFKRENVDKSERDEDMNVVFDREMNDTNVSSSYERVRCKSAISSESCENEQISEDTTLLSAAQKAGCFSYIKRRYSIAIAFASNEPSEEFREPSNISPADESVHEGSNWEAIKAKHGVQMFKSKRSRCEVRGVTHVNASVKNVMTILAAGENTEIFAAAQKTILGADQVIEAKVLASCAPSTNSRFFHCGLKYLAIKNPFGTAPLDLVYLDYTDVKTTKDGKLIGYRILESIRVPELRASSKFVRASIRCEVYTVVETESPGVVEVTFASHLDPKSKCASSKRSLWLELAGLRLANIRSHAEKTSIGHHLARENPDEMIRRHRSFTSGDKDKQQRKCNVCQHTFSFLRKRHDCRLCGEASCGRCCRKMPVLVETESIRVKVCLSCILHSRNNPDEIRRGELGQSSRRRDIGNSTFIIYDE